MKINVKFFASVREAVGSGSEQVGVADGVTTVGQLRAQLAARGGAWQQALGSSALRMACNQVMCDADTALADGAEVAFFPPVTGG
ncbi:MAG: molybdopterin converting factor subunit 1 [Sphingomonadaceae bacterium]